MTEPRRWKEPDSEAPRDVQAMLRNHQAEAKTIPRPKWQRETASRGFDLRWGAAAAVLAALVIFWAVRTPISPNLQNETTMAGIVAQGTLTSENRQLATNDGLALPITVETNDMPATVRLNNGDRLELSAQGKFTLKTLPECSPCLVIHRGDATLDAELRTASTSPLVVHAAPWRVIVLGTRFSVKRHPPLDVRVDVDRGVVRVEGPKPSRELRAGEHFDSRGVVTATATASILPEPSAVLPALAPTAPPPVRGEKVTQLPRRKARESVAAVNPTEPRAAPSVKEAVSAKDEQLALLQKARQTNNSAAALEALDAAAAMGPPLAEVASYRAARLSFKDGAFLQASERLRRHIKTWPQGELVRVVYLDLIEADLRRGDIDAAQDQLHKTLARFPDLGSGAPLQFLRAEIARAQKGWAEAAMYYARAAQVPEYAPRALFLEALSLARSGERTVARKKMAEYLKRFPNGVFAEEAQKALGKDSEAQQP